MDLNSETVPRYAAGKGWNTSKHYEKHGFGYRNNVFLAWKVELHGSDVS